jgi:hypothetical protein
MICFWNRAEVGVFNSMQKFNETLDKLAALHINYTYRMVNLIPNRGRYGSFGVNLDASVMYYVYVHQKDLDAAVAAINKRPG